MSSFVPKVIACVGQALAQAGPCPTATRSEQRVHFFTTWLALSRGMSNGQPEMQ